MPGPVKKATFASDKGIQRLQPRSTRYEAWDTQASGLALRVNPTGKKSFVWFHRVGKKIKTTTMGRYGSNPGQLTLAMAREQLRGLQGHFGQEDTPNDIRTVEDLARAFYKNVPLMRGKNRDNPRGPRDWRYIDLDIIPALGHYDAKTVTPKMLTDLIRAKAEGNPRKDIPPAPVAAMDLSCLLKLIFEYAMDEKVIINDPAASIKAKNFGARKSQIRDRALDVTHGLIQKDREEIRALWNFLTEPPEAMGRLSISVRYAVKILLLTAVRTGDLINAKWEHVNFDEKVWTVPDTKTGKTLHVPLSDLALQQFEALRARFPKATFVIPGKDKKKPLSDKAIGLAVRRMCTRTNKKGERVLPIEPFTPHDLRRTFKSHAGELDISWEASERVLGHSLGAMDQTYNASYQIKTCREALDLWSAAVDEAINKPVEQAAA